MTTGTNITPPQPPHQPHHHNGGGMNGSAVHALPWFVRVFYSPALLANIVAFGAAILLLYTAAIEWPRKTERFYEQLTEQRDATRELASLARENQRLLARIEQLENHQQTQLQGIQKVLTEMWFRFLAWDKKDVPKPKDDDG